MSDAVLSQLVELESQLDAQEATLMAQLGAIKGQRQGLQTVITLFQSPASNNGAGLSADVIQALSGAAVAAVAAPVVAAPAATKGVRGRKSVKEEVAAPAAPKVGRGAKAAAVKAAVKEVAPAKVGRGKKSAAVVAAPAPKAKPGRKPRATKPEVVADDADSGRKARAGKAPNWQRFVQDPFRKTPLPDVVANILKAQPDDAFKIADVMDAIFKEDMPKATFLKARNRVSNILSAGARTSEWYRGRGGQYSLSQKLLK
jgi:hypothetical protein